MSNLYTTRTKVKARMVVTDSVDDAAIDAALATVSREIDRHCGRRFYVEQRTRYYTPRNSLVLRVDDLLAITTLKTDPDGDGTYEETWASTDYRLHPRNVLFDSPPQPYTRVVAGSFGDYTFPRVLDGVELTGKWGYYEVLETVASLLNEALDASETGVDVVDGTAYEAGQTILVDAEQMYISSISTNTLTVTRGVNGTTAATHDTGATIQRYTYPVIGEACLDQVLLQFRVGATSSGMFGTEEWKQPIAVGLHPFVQRKLESFRRLEAG